MIGILCFLVACSPNFISPLSPESSSANISEHIFTSYDNTKLPLKIWLPPNEISGVIVAVHGFNDYSNFTKDSASYFNNQKLAVYSYDQRGFGATTTRGRWSGRDALANDLTNLVELVKTRHPSTPVYILGHSMGGAVAILAITRKKRPSLNGVILVAPAVWARSEMPLYQSWLLWIAAHTMPWKKLTGSSLEITASDNIEMLKELGKDPLVIKETRIDVLYGLSNLMDEAYRSAESISTNVLFLYGEKDEIIPKKPVFNFLSRLSIWEERQRQVIFYENGYHMLLRDLQAEVVMKDIVTWIHNQNQPVSLRENSPTN